MRTAEALRLGSLVLKPLRGIRYNGAGGGCALGMIDLSLGSMVAHDWRTPLWMNTTLVSSLPCGCKGPTVMGAGGQQVRIEYVRVVSAITVHLFNQHVIDGDWTIDRLAEWLDSVDPTPREHDDPRPMQVESDLDKEMSWQTKL